jgi:hypothetical protein
MMHLSQEDLVGLAYGEGAPADDHHLAGCAECARSVAELKSDLAELKLLGAPIRDEHYGERVWDAISSTLPPYESPSRKWFGSRVVWGLGYAAVCAALVAGAFYAGRQWEHGRKQPVTASKSALQPRQPIVVVVLSDHLDRSERLLVELKHVDGHNSEMFPPLRDEARTLLAANRVCRKNAEQAGDPALEGALDHLDHLLGELANQPGGLNAAAIAHLQDEMNTDGLLFEVRVLRSRVHDTKSGPRKSTIGGTA